MVQALVRAMMGRLRTVKKNADAKRIIGSFFSLIILRGMDLLIPLLTLPYLVKTLGIERFGLVNLSLSLALYFGSIIQYGYGITATRDIARTRDDQKKVNEIFSTVFSATLILGGLCLLILAAVIFSTERFRKEASLYFLSSLFIFLQSLFPLWLFQGLEKLKLVTYINLAVKLMTLAGIFTFIHQSSDYAFVSAINAIGAATGLALSLWAAYSTLEVRWIPIGLTDIYQSWKKGWNAFISQIMPNLYNNSSTFLLGLYAGNHAVGIFSGATKLIDATSSLGYIMSGAFFPYLSRKPGGHRVFARLMLGVSLVLCIALFFTSDFVAQLLFKEGAAEISQTIKIFSPTPIFLFLMLTYGTNYLMLHGKERAVKNISLACSITFFLIGFIFIKKYEIFGAILTLLGARFAMASAYYLVYLSTKNKP